jgi:hypothetical protein
MLIPPINGAVAHQAETNTPAPVGSTACPLVPESHALLGEG